MALIKRASERRFNEAVTQHVRRVCGPKATVNRERIQMAWLEGATIAEAADEEADRILRPDRKKDPL